MIEPIELKTKEDFRNEEMNKRSYENPGTILVEAEGKGIFGHIVYRGAEGWQLCTSLADAGKKIPQWSDDDLYILTIKLKEYFEEENLKYYHVPFVRF